MDSGRRSVYLGDLDREVWVKVENIKLVRNDVDLPTAGLLLGVQLVLSRLKHEAVNGKRGIIGALDGDAERYGTYIPELKKEIWVKEENISVTEEGLALYYSGMNIELEGLQAESMKGTKGIAGRYDPELGRQSIFVPEQNKEIWVKVVNTRLDDAPIFQDRLGNVSLHEVVMHDREDRAKLLLEKYNTSIHTQDLDGSNPLQMIVRVGAAMNTKVGRIISAVTRREAKVAHNAKKTAVGACANCDIPLGTDGG